MRKATLAFFAAVLALGIFAVPAPAAPDTILATHDGNSYTLEDFNIFFLKQVGARGLVAFLEQALVYEEAKKLNLVPTAEEKQKFINDTMSPAIYKGFQELYTPAALNRFIEYTMMNERYRKHLEQKFIKEKNINFTDEDANRFYVKNIGLFQPGDRVWMSIISVETMDNAKEVLKKLGEGEDFNELASVYNVDSDLRGRAGYVGMMEKGTGLPAPIEDAAFSMEKNKYSQVIKGSLFHIIYIHDIKPKENHPFAEVKDDIKTMLKNDLVQKYIDEHLNELYTRELQKFDIKAQLFKPEEQAQ